MATARPGKLYAGMLYHAGSGLYLTKYRAYDSTTGRWVSRDPLREVSGPNLYGYVDGNPLSRIDPWGLVDVSVVDPSDPYYAPTNNYNPSDIFTFAGHGNQTDPSHLSTIGEAGGKLGLTSKSVSVEMLGKMILAKWDGKKPLYSLACHGNSSGFNANLAQYLADKIGQNVSIYGEDGLVTATTIDGYYKLMLRSVFRKVVYLCWYETRRT